MSLFSFQKQGMTRADAIAIRDAIGLVIEVLVKERIAPMERQIEALQAEVANLKKMPHQSLKQKLAQKGVRQ